MLITKSAGKGETAVGRRSQSIKEKLAPATVASAVEEKNGTGGHVNDTDNTQKHRNTDGHSSKCSNNTDDGSGSTNDRAHRIKQRQQRYQRPREQDQKLPPITTAATRLCRRRLPSPPQPPPPAPPTATTRPSSLTGAAMCEFLLEFLGLTAGAAVWTVVPSGSRFAHSSGSPCATARQHSNDKTGSTQEE